MCQDKDSFVKQKQRPYMEAKENKMCIHSVPSGGDIHHFLGSRTLVCVSDCSGGQTSY